MMNSKALKQQAREVIALPTQAPAKTMAIVLAVFYTAALVLDLILIRLDESDASGISSTLLYSNGANLVSALFYGLQIIGIVLDGCFVGFACEILRHRNPDLRTIWNYVNRAFPVLGSYMLSAIYQALWTVLFMIPAFILMTNQLASMLTNFETATEDVLLSVINEYMASDAFIAVMLLMLAASIGGFIISYRYRLATYFSVQPGWHAGQAVRASKSILKGNKVRLFKLDLSMLWYHALAFAPTVIIYLIPYFVEDATSIQDSIEIFSYVWTFILEAAFRCYKEVVYAGFAEALIKEHVNNTSDSPLLISQ